MLEFEGSAIDLKEIALKIAREPAIKEDGTPLVANGKEVSKIEKVMREWAASSNPDLQKRFVEIVNKEERLDEKSIEGFMWLIVFACSTTDEKRKEILEKYENMDMSESVEKAVLDAKQLGEKSKGITSKVGIYLPHNGRGEPPQ
jgi:hypothetical protein